MRFLRITTNYHEYLTRFYARRPQLKSEPYSKQHAALMEDCYGWADFWSAALQQVGYETLEIVANAEFAQKQWAQENDINYDEKTWLHDIATAQIKAFKPDVLFAVDYVTLNAPFLRHIRRACSSIRMVLGWCGSPYRDESVFHEYDYVLSCIPEMVKHFREQGHRSAHINHAFDQRILGRIDLTRTPSVDFAFIGSINRQIAGHLQRETLLLKLLQHTNLKLWLMGARPSLKRWYQVSARQYAYDMVTLAQQAGIPQRLLSSLPPVRKVMRWEDRPELQSINGGLARRAEDALFGLDMFQKLRESKVILNIHIDISPESASNMRLFEATGVGSCLLTDWKANLPDLFDSDREVVTYRSDEECLEKVRYLLDHENERQAIAAAGQQRTLRDHSFVRRAEQLSELIRNGFDNRL